MKNLAPLLLLFIFLSLGCKKSPRVKIQSPKDGQEYFAGQKIDVQVKQKNCWLLMLVAGEDTVKLEPVTPVVHFEIVRNDPGNIFLEVFGFGIGQDRDVKFLKIK